MEKVTFDPHKGVLMKMLNPRICLPTDPKRQEVLKEKEKEYARRIDTESDPLLVMDAMFKKSILAKLFSDKEVGIEVMEKQFTEIYGSEFLLNEFHEAWDVMDDYCTTGGKDCIGGTGLPQVI